MVILTVAARYGSHYEWEAHTRLGLAAGLDGTELELLRRGKLTGFEDPAERAALELAVIMLDGRRVDDGLYAMGERRLGAGGILEVTVLVGYYGLLAQLLAVFAVAAPSPSNG
jgi:4-carboxymuconolactone decarboxylase